MSDFHEKKHVSYGGVRFNVISVTRGSMGITFSGKKRYETLEWPLSSKDVSFIAGNTYPACARCAVVFLPRFAVTCAHAVLLTAVHAFAFFQLRHTALGSHELNGNKNFIRPPPKKTFKSYTCLVFPFSMRKNKTKLKCLIVHVT